MNRPVNEPGGSRLCSFLASQSSRRAPIAATRQPRFLDRQWPDSGATCGQSARVQCASSGLKAVAPGGCMSRPRDLRGRCLCLCVWSFRIAFDRYGNVFRSKALLCCARARGLTARSPYDTQGELLCVQLSWHSTAAAVGRTHDAIVGFLAQPRRSYPQRRSSMNLSRYPCRRIRRMALWELNCTIYAVFLP